LRHLHSFPTRRSSDLGIGQTRGGRNTKLHAVCDDKGRPHVLLPTPGNVHDMRVAKDCIEALPPSSELVADKGYDSNDLRAWLAEDRKSTRLNSSHDQI